MACRSFLLLHTHLSTLRVKFLSDFLLEKVPDFLLLRVPTHFSLRRHQLAKDRITVFDEWLEQVAHRVHELVREVVPVVEWYVVRLDPPGVL